MGKFNKALAYKNHGLEYQAYEKSSEELIAMLFEAACSKLTRATLLDVRGLENRKPCEKVEILGDFHSCISKVQQVISAAIEMLDFEAGGDLARQLRDTYSIILKGLSKSSKDLDIDSLKKYLEALRELKDGWKVAAETSVNGQRYPSGINQEVPVPESQVESPAAASERVIESYSPT